MAQQCVSASDQYFTFPALGTSAPPITMSIWFKVASIVVGKHTAMFCWRGSINTEFFLRSSGSTWQLRYSIAGGSQWNITTGLNVSTGIWQHACVAITSSQARLYLDGTVFTANVSHGSTSFDDTGYLAKDPFEDGARVSFNGAIGEAAIWNAALTSEECQALAKRVSPLALAQRIPNLVLYRDLMRETTRGIGPALTAVNSPTVAAHPPVVHRLGKTHIGVRPAHFVAPYLPARGITHTSRVARAAAETAGVSAGTIASYGEVSS